MDLKSKIILIYGPTASGKSNFAIKLAKKIRGEIVNADSMQVYKELKILSEFVDVNRDAILKFGSEGLDVISETITLNGTSNVNLVEDYYRILKLSVATAGNNALNQGNIKVFDPTGGAVFGSMAAGDNTSNQAVISPSTGNDILLEKIHVMGHFETPVEIKVNIYEESKQLQKTIYKFFGSSNGNEFSLNVRKKLIAGDTLWVSVNPLAAVTGSHNRVAVLLEGTEKSKSVIVPSLV